MFSFIIIIIVIVFICLTFSNQINNYYLLKKQKTKQIVKQGREQNSMVPNINKKENKTKKLIRKFVISFEG